MNHAESTSRRAHLRALQSAAAKVTPDKLDYDALRSAAIDFGVPEQYAGYVRGDFKDRPAEHSMISHALTMLPADEVGVYGQSITANKIPDAAKVAAAVFNGAVVRGYCATWVDFPEFAKMNQKRVAMSTEDGEWDRGRIMDWEIEMDSMNYSYDLVVLNAIHPKPATDFVDRELYSLLANRMSRNLFTVVTHQRPHTDRERAAFLNRFADSLVPHIDDYYLNHRIERISDAGK